MSFSKLSLFLCFLSICAFEFANSASPTPSVDCSSLVLNMADCLSYVSNGSTVEKPEGSCCNGLKTVLRTNAECLCEGFKSSASMGVVLNMTKAMALPAACKVSAPSASKCGLSLTPTSAPALAPEAFSPADAMAPTGSDGADSTAPAASAGEDSTAPGMAPAQSPGSSASSMLTASIASLVIGLVAVALFSSF